MRAYDESQVVGSWQKRGLKNVRMLHTHDPKVADTENFIRDFSYHVLSPCAQASAALAAQAGAEAI